ncbi:MAG: Hsp20/alpha crystallin family protein [Elusimicrobiota bacterium]
MEHEKFFQLLSDFIDDELDTDLLDDFERELEDDFCRCYFNTFKKTVDLCHQIGLHEVPKNLHYNIIRTIEDTPQKGETRIRKMHQNKQAVMNMTDIIKFEPFRELLDIRDAFDRFFGKSLSQKGLDTTKDFGFTPKIEIDEKKDAVVVKVEVPGIEKKDIKVKFEQGNLTLTGESKKEEEKKEKGYYYSERRYGNFYRSISLPAAVDEKNIKAKYKDGILNITLPKTRQAKVKIKEIEIE